MKKFLTILLASALTSLGAPEIVKTDSKTGTVSPTTGGAPLNFPNDTKLGNSPFASLFQGKFTGGVAGNVVAATGATTIGDSGTALSSLQGKAGVLALAGFSAITGAVAESNVTNLVSDLALKLTASDILPKTLTGFTSAAGTVSASDSILGAIGKLDGNVGLKVEKANNLSDLASAATARTNLGLGTAATTAASAYATAAQGVTTLSLTTPNVLYTTPVTFSNTAGAWSGTLALNTKTANTVFAGPTSGVAATPTMRALVTADLPAAFGTPASLTLTNATGLPSGALTGNIPAAWLGVTGTTALAGNTSLLQLGTTSTTALAGNTVLPANTTATANQYFTAYNSATGAFTKGSVTVPTIPSTSSVLKGDGAGNAVAATAGTDFAGIGSANTYTAAQTVSGASFGLSGNISAPAWGTAGVRYKNVSATLTDTSTAASATVATAYTSVWGDNTIAATNTGVVFTNYFANYFKDPVAGTNVTLTNKWALGADSLKVGTSNPLTISPSGVLNATSPVFTTPSLGTPSALTLTNATGLPISTGVSGLGTGVGTFLATPTSANLAAALTDETGTGAAVFGTSPTFTTSLLFSGGGSVTAASGAVGINAGGTNQNITLTPSGTGGVTLTHTTWLQLRSDQGIGLHGIRAYAATTEFANNSSVRARLDGQGNYLLASTGAYQFGNGALVAGATTTADTGLARNAAGVVEINNGTAGTFRDIIVRDATASTGNVIVGTAGKGVQIKGGTNARIGTGAMLVAGTIAVSNTSVTANTRVFITRTAVGGTPATGGYTVTTTASTSFTITAISATTGLTSAADTSTFDWMLVEQN